MKLCSFIIPTRSASHESLSKSILSIGKYGWVEGDPDFEILLRVDDDDKDRINFLDPISEQGFAKVVVGPRGNGYNNMGTFVNDLVSIADSHWCWLHDDDAYIDGDWYSPLNAIKCDPEHGPGANSEYYVLGESFYRNGARGGAPGIIIPTALAKTINHHNPVDQQWLNHIMGMGWIIHQLASVRYHHCGRQR